MKSSVKVLKLISDATRLRILLLLSERELCVCQIMGILGVSQPLVSRNLGLLDSADFLTERKVGKLVFYRLNKNMPSLQRRLVDLLKDDLGSDTLLKEDIRSLKDCEAFQRKTGKCDMKTFSAYLSQKRSGAVKRQREGRS